MRVLAIETSTLWGSVACLEGDALTEKALRRDQRSAQSLAPAIRALLAEVAWQPSDIDLVAVTNGPGSFTGLRVGVTTAKMLAFACDAQVCGVNTLEVIAHQVPHEHGSIVVAIDAQRQQLFSARFQRTSTSLEEQSGTEIVGQTELVETLEGGWCVAGAGLKRLLDGVTSDVHIVDEKYWEPMASTVGRIARHRHRSGKTIEPTMLVPQYFRRSAAEEKLG